MRRAIKTFKHNSIVMDAPSYLPTFFYWIPEKIWQGVWGQPMATSESRARFFLAKKACLKGFYVDIYRNRFHKLLKTSPFYGADIKNIA
jgi:hypothetical protein